MRSRLTTTSFAAFAVLVVAVGSAFVSHPPRTIESARRTGEDTTTSSTRPCKPLPGLPLCENWLPRKRKLPFSPTAPTTSSTTTAPPTTLPPSTTTVAPAPPVTVRPVPSGCVPPPRGVPLTIDGDYHLWADWCVWLRVFMCEQPGPNGEPYWNPPAGHSGGPSSTYPGGGGIFRGAWADYAAEAGVAQTNGALATPGEQIRVARVIRSHHGLRAWSCSARWGWSS